MATRHYHPFPRFTYDEFLQRNARSSEKLEYLQGTVFAMAGGTQFHNEIAINFSFSLKLRLRGKGCRVLSSDQLIATPGQDAAFYPDLSVACGPRPDTAASVLSNPVLVVEVLSPSTRDYDLGQKFQQYRRIPSLRHIVFIDCPAIGVQVYTRGADEVWPGLPETFHSLDQSAHLSALGIDIPLSEIYQDLQ